MKAVNELLEDALLRTWAGDQARQVSRLLLLTEMA
jgi:hypothetical protein